MRRFRARCAATVVALSALSGMLGGCSTTPDAEPVSGVESLTVEVIRTLPHDPDAFTQGLEFDDGRLYEGTGIAGRSWVRSTGVLGDDTITTGPTIAQANLEAPLFGEGITVSGDTLWQLTWRDGVAIARDKDTLAERDRIPTTSEGWGICSFGATADSVASDRLVTSDGTSTLTIRDHSTFEPVATVDVTRAGHSVEKLNELECAEDGSVYANVWTTDTIVRIRPDDGVVTATIDASALRRQLDTSGATHPVDVLNGIAQIPGTDRFLVTGKYWPQAFEVRFVA